MNRTPIGATHKKAHISMFYKKRSDGDWLYFNDTLGKWVDTLMDEDFFFDLIPVDSTMKECPRHGGSYDTSVHDHCPCLDRFEQPKPTGDGERVVPMVMNDLITRMEKGIAVYDKALSINNGRDALQDAYEEALDLACYLRQLIEERRA